MIKKRIWTQQPQQAAQIDSYNPLTKSLVSACDFVTFRDIVLSSPFAINGTVIKKVGKTGIGAEFTPTSGLSFVSGGFSSLVPVSSAFTLFISIRVKSLGSRQIFLGDSSGVGDNDSIFVEQTAANQWRVVSNDSTLTSRSVVGGTVTVGEHALCVVWDKSSLYLYVDGALIGSTAYTNNRAAGISYQLGRTGAYAGGVGFSGSMYTHYVLNRACLLPEVASLFGNPWQIFHAPDSRIFVPTGGTSTATYTIYPTGSLVFNNTTPSIKTNVLSTSGNITYSGTNNIIFSNGATTYTITPSGSISYINSSILRRDRVLYASGNIIYSGIIVTQHTKALSVNGLITYTGSATNIRIKLINPTGNITYTGTNPIYVPGSGVVTTRLPLTGAGN